MKLIRQIILALGLLAAFICLTVFSSTEYPANNSNSKAANDKLPFVSDAFSGLNTIISYTDKIPLLKVTAATTTIKTVDSQIAPTVSETPQKINNILEKTDIKDKEAELIDGATIDSFRSFSFSDLLYRLKKVLNRDWSGF